MNQSIFLDYGNGSFLGLFLLLAHQSTFNVQRQANHLTCRIFQLFLGLEFLRGVHAHPNRPIDEPNAPKP